MSSNVPASNAHADAARMLLEKAGGDVTVVQKLSDDMAVPDDVIGFHAQQAIEKSIKAVLTWHGIVYRRTHDLLEIAGICQDSGIEIPLNIEKLALLNPFAVEFRYGFAEEIEETLERRDARLIAEEGLAWANEIVTDGLKE